MLLVLQVVAEGLSKISEYANRAVRVIVAVVVKPDIRFRRKRGGQKRSAVHPNRFCGRSIGTIRVDQAEIAIFSQPKSTRVPPPKYSVRAGLRRQGVEPVILFALTPEVVLIVRIGGVVPDAHSGLRPDDRHLRRNRTTVSNSE